MKFNAKKFVCISDIDGTLLCKNPTRSEINAANSVRRFINAQGTFGTVTAQTAEMGMSSGAYAASVLYGGFKRARPLLGIENGRHVYRPPESLEERHAFTDPDLIMSLGTGNHYRNASGFYSLDRGFDTLLGGINWRESAKKAVRYAAEAMRLERPARAIDLEAYYSMIENPVNYETGLRDVMPLEYRLQFEFLLEDARENLYLKERAKVEILSTIGGLEFASKLETKGVELAELTREFKPILNNFVITDESSPASENRLLFYATPTLATKEHMVSRALTRMFGNELIEDLLIAGDMPPDIRAGVNTNDPVRRKSFLLVGGSPLSGFLVPGTNEPNKLYAGESFRWLHQILSPMDRPGFGQLPAKNGREIRFINGAIAYPETKGPETIKAYLEDEYSVTLH